MRLRLATVNRATLRAAYEILHHELVPAAAAQDVDEFYRAHGRYMTDSERASLMRASEAKPRRGFSDADRARLERLVREAAVAVRAEHPSAMEEELERLTRQRLETMAER